MTTQTLTSCVNECFKKDIFYWYSNETKTLASYYRIMAFVCKKKIAEEEKEFFNNDKRQNNLHTKK